MSHRSIVPVLLLAVFTLIGCGGTRQAALPAGADSPNVVAVIDQELLTLAEFEERYARTAGGREAALDDSLEAYQDFLDRYVNFRLKVKAAREAGLDRDPAVVDEITTYRANLARPYLIDREVLDPLIRQMYDRKSELISASHILIRIPEGATPADTLAAYERLDAVRDSALAGVNFAELAVRHSEDPSVSRPGPGFEGKLGYFSAGRMIDEFEDVAYATAVGEISPVFRTQFGYHILRVDERRENVPSRTVAHIMVVPRSDSAEALAAAHDTIQVIQSKLALGQDFGELAGTYSGDRRSAAQGGQLPAISYEANLPESFLNAVYALDAEGEVSDVVETQYGLHLIKLLERGSNPTYEQAYDELKEQVSRLPRAKRAEAEFANSLWDTYGGSVDTTTLLQAIAPYELDSLLAWTAADSLPETLASTAIATLGDSTYSVAHFLDFAQRQGIPRTSESERGVRLTLAAFASDAALTYETAALEQRNEEFARVMSEFRDGLVLFSLMEDSVWNAAAEDSLALLAHYEANRESYRFPERTRVVAFYSTSDSLLQDVASRLDAGTAPQMIRDALLADSSVVARVDTVRIAEETSSIFDQALTLSEGGYVGPLQHNREWLLMLNDGTEAPRLKTFEEARATVVSEYQDVLEEAMISRLRDRYRVHLFPERLHAAFSGPAESGEPVSSNR